MEPVLIAGAGPVGLTLALLFHERGRAVRVFEAVEELRPLGVGINLLPHSSRVLCGLGLGPGLDTGAIRTSALHYYNKLGQLIWSEPRGLGAGYRFPQYSIHRGVLQMLLLDEVRRRLGAESVITGHRLTDWKDTPAGVSATFATRSSGAVAVPGACLVAADGIKSTARNKLYPAEGPPLYGDRLLWRGVTEARGFLDGSTMFMAGHQDRKFVAYPLAHLDGGRDRINWIAELSVPDYRLEDQDWSKEVSAEVFAESFRSWNFGWIDIPAIIAGCQHVYEFPLADRDPLPRWSFGNATLIGDAAHPMYPIGSNGASQGILDAERLVAAFEEHDDVAGAFAAYEADRRPATAKIVLSNRQNGPEQVMQIAEERAPEGFGDVHDVISQAELEAIAARYKATAGFSVQAVNEKA